jgi:enoyl-CoA hydratase/carnithine racemase
VPEGAPVTEEVHGKALVATIAHGKANALSSEVLALLGAALDRVEHGGDDGPGALVVTGTPGMLSGGFDLTVMRSGPKEAGRLVTEGGALFTRFFSSPVPVLVACTGHAIAAGALLMLGADYRVGAAGAFRIGLIETQLGMVLPRWATELGEERLSRRHFQQATVGARIYDPPGALDAGFLDAVVAPDAVLAATLEEAERWAALPRAAYAGQVKLNRGARIAALEAAVAADHDLVFDVGA